MPRAPRRPSDPSTTDRLPDEGADVAGSTPRRDEPPFALVVLRDGELSTHRLPAKGRLVIGRSPTADLRVDHGSVSREHAALWLGDELRIEDLGSSNGTRVRDVPLAPFASTEIFPDDVVDLGAVILVVQYRSLSQRLRRLCDSAFFDLRLDEEAARARRTGTTFEVALLHIEGGLGPHAVQRLLAAALRPADLVTTRAPSRYEVLLTEPSREARRDRLQRAIGSLTRRGLRVTETTVAHPARGLTIQPTRHATLGGIIARDEASLRLFRLIERVAESMLSVLFLGETGVGKEVCAEHLHRRSPRRDRPFLRMNCAALSETLVDSELFGHERGAFTGASSEKVGLLEAASGGTVFLDEIGDMPLATQVKLLRVLECKEVTRVGAVKSRPVDLRIVAATHRDLPELITEGRFREDLYYRLNGISVLVPPLRERPADVEPLARHFIARFTAKGAAAPGLSRESVAALEAARWPGNVRQLRNLIERAVALCDAPTLAPQNLPFEAPGPTASPAPGSLRDEVRALERERIERALVACRGNQRRTAELLGISRGALLRRLEQLGIDGAPRSVK